jgi:hypothetical protein
MPPSIPDIGQVYRSLSTLQFVCDKLGGNYHKEAVIAVVSRYRKAENYPDIRRLAAMMLSMRGRLGDKTDLNNPDVNARMRIFRIVYDHCAVLEKSAERWNAVGLDKPDRSKSLIRNLNECLENEKAKVSNFADLETMVQAIPQKLDEVRAELEKIPLAPPQLQALIDGGSQAARDAADGIPGKSQLEVIERRLHGPRSRRDSQHRHR